MTADSARHPFRQGLPRHVLQGLAIEPAMKPGRERRAIDLRDWRDFMAAYCATFVAVMIFIS